MSPEGQRSVHAAGGRGYWVELIARGDKAMAELVSAILIEAGSPATEQTPQGSIRAYLYMPTKAVLEGLNQRLSALGWSLTHRPFENTDWQQEWKRHIRPIRIKPFYIYQSFTKKPPPEGYIPIQIDPSMAFGTGSHPSTKLALKGLAWVLCKKQGAAPTKDRPTVLDVGTGSGILAIGAKMLGAEVVVATDIDELALKQARRNARINGTTIRVTRKGLDRIRGTFSVVVANIIRRTLVELAGGLSDRVSRDGWLLLSGLLKEDEAAILEGFSPFGFRPERRFTMGQWLALAMRRD